MFLDRPPATTPEGQGDLTAVTIPGNPHIPPNPVLADRLDEVRSSACPGVIPRPVSTSEWEGWLNQNRDLWNDLQKNPKTVLGWVGDTLLPIRLSYLNTERR